MHEAASNPTAAEERPRLIIIGLIVWVILQVPRLIAIPLIQGVLDDTESDAWMFPAILDILVAVAAPFMAVALWRARDLWVWVTAIVFFTVSIVDHLDAITAGLLARLGSGTVDVSNVHFAPRQPFSWHEVVAAAGACFPGRDLVGYEQGHDLDAALAAGFDPVGDLRVWVP